MAEPNDPRFNDPDFNDPDFNGQQDSSNLPPRKSWKDRLLSGRTARFVAASGVPYAMTGDDSSQGQLVEAVAEFGWQTVDSDPAADAIIEKAPFRISGFRAGHIVAGRFDPFAARRSEGLPSGEWSFTAFDAVNDSRVGRAVGHCFTAVPTMVELPELRVLPARFMTGPARGMVVYPTVDQIFDARFKLLAANGERELETLTTLVDDDVRSILCAGNDREEIWTSGRDLVVSTSAPHDEELLARHLEILGGMLRAIRGAL